MTEKPKIRNKSNKIIQHLVKTGKLSHGGLPHYGGKQTIYQSGKTDKWEGNINLFELGEILFDMTDDEVEKLVDNIKTYW